MKAKWYRRVGGKHVKFNLSKSGITTSFKLGPITINPQRNSYFIKTGILGLSLRGKLNEEAREASASKQLKSAFNQATEVFIELRDKLEENEITELMPLIDDIIKYIKRGDMKSPSFINELNKLEYELMKLENIEFEDGLYSFFEELRTAKLGSTLSHFEIFIMAFFILILLCTGLA